MRLSPALRVLLVVCTALLVVGADCSLTPDPPAVEPTPGWVVSRPFPQIETLYDIDVFTDLRAYAVGTDGAVLRYDDGEWLEEESGVDADLRSLSGLAAIDSTDDFAMAVGEGGTVIVRRDDVWTTLDSGTDEVLFGVWVRAIDDAFIVGDRGVILRWDGVTFVSMAEQAQQVTQLVLEGVPAPNDAGVIVDNGFVPPEGAFECGPPGPEQYCAYSSLAAPLKSVDGNGADSVYAVAPAGAVYHFDGERWNFDETYSTRSLSHVFVQPGIWAVGSDGTVLRRNGPDDWDARQYKLDLPVYMQGLFAFGGGDVYAAGLAGSLFHYADGEWETIELEGSAQLRAVHGIVTDADADPPEQLVFAVGAGGFIARGPLAVPNAFEVVSDGGVPAF